MLQEEIITYDWHPSNTVYDIGVHSVQPKRHRVLFGGAAHHSVLGKHEPVLQNLDGPLGAIESLAALILGFHPDPFRLLSRAIQLPNLLTHGGQGRTTSALREIEGLTLAENRTSS